MKKTINIEGINYTTDTTKAFRELMESEYKRYESDFYTYDNIWDAYDRPSWEKEKIWNRWATEFRALGAYKIRVMSRNTFQFTVGAEFEKDGKNYFAYITPTWNRIIELS